MTMGMTLTQVSRLMEADPGAARALLQEAKGDSSAALAELRSLVRGIRPPILADRGLAEALRSLAAGSPIDTVVASDLDGPLMPTIETALYFAVAELLANAVKHSAASQVVIELAATRDTITATVTDNGIGGRRRHRTVGWPGFGAAWTPTTRPLSSSARWAAPRPRPSWSPAPSTDRSAAAQEGQYRQHAPRRRGLTGQVELREDGVDVLLHRLLGHDEPLRDHRVGLSLGHA